MNWRGEYEGGGYRVTAKRWWWPRDRAAAKTAAIVLEYERDRIRGKVTEALVRGEYMYLKWS